MQLMLPAVRMLPGFCQRARHTRPSSPPRSQMSVLADAVHNKQPVPEGFQLIIDSMAGL